MHELSAEEVVQEKLLSLDYTFPPSIPEDAFDAVSIFPKIKGLGWKKDVKRRLLYLYNCESQLQKALLPGETVKYVALGVQQKLLEQYFLGIFAQSINQTLFVFTNLRILLFNSDRKGHPKHSYWSIYYNEIKKFKGFISTMTLKLHDKSTYKYTHFKGKDKKRIPKLVEEAIGEYELLNFQPESSQSRENLCTTCLQVVPTQVYQCPTCQREYFTPWELTKRSLIFPSWGDFTMGHRLVGSIELASYLICCCVSLTAVFNETYQRYLNNNLSILDVFFALLTPLFIFLFLHLPDAFLTYFLAKKGLTPKQQSNRDATIESQEERPVHD